MSLRRVRSGAVLLALLVPFGLAGCSAGLAEAVGDVEACQAAAAVSSAGVGDSEALVTAFDAFAALAPEELQTPLALLASGGEQGSAAQQQAALAAVQGWVAKHCDARFTLGSAPEVSATDARLDDFRVIVGGDDAGVTVAVLGVTELDVAVALCEQAVEAHTADAAALSVRVFGPQAIVLASNDEGGCAVAPGFS